MKQKNAIVFLAWGNRFIDEVCSCIAKSKPYISEYDLILITDEDSDTSGIEDQVSRVIHAPFELTGLLRKTEIIKFLPDNYTGFLFLDSDTIVVQDLSLGFEKAKLHGIALSPAPHYSLDAFLDFDRIMESEIVPRSGQLQYNTGVIFFSRSPRVMEVFDAWGNLGLRHQDFRNDQPFFSLAMEQLAFNPYTLSISYNYRGIGQAISGDVRIWHSHGKMPLKINDYEWNWPGRRAWPGRMRYPKGKKKTLVSRVLKELRRLIKKK